MSQYIRSRRHAGANAVALLSAVPMAVLAQTAPTTPQPTDGALPTVSVKAQREVPFKADTSASSKITQPLIDTPKTITVIKKETLQEQGATTLMEALRNTPGITMQLGENGNTSAGDAFQLRGFSAQNSTFVDGIRDLGAVTRDTFNLEQVEIVKGPAGADIGRGASGGYINLISKLPSLDDSRQGSLTLGTASKKRATADLNQAIGDSTAIRLNLMAQKSGVDGRDEVENKGYGVAPSIAFGLNTPTRVFLYSQHMRQDNTPDGGIPTIGMDGYYRAVTASGTSATTAEQAAAITAGERVRPENYYGSKDDYEKVKADMVTTRFEHDLTPTTTLRSAFRFGRTHMDRVLTGISSTINGSDIGSPIKDPSEWTVGRSRQRTDQTNEIIANQTSVTTSFVTGGLKHDLSGGLELTHERQQTLGTGTTAQTIKGVNYTAIAIPAANLYDPNTNDVLGIPYLTGADTEGTTLTAAVYAFDTLTLNEQWKLNAGLRFERYRITTKAGTIVTSANLSSHPGYAVGGIDVQELRDADNLLSWNLGAVYKPTADGTVYAAYSNSLTPPGSANFSLSATVTNAANSAMDPQETNNIELGTKWDLLDKRLNVSAALYRSENSKQVTQDTVDPTIYRQEGKTRITGLELSAVGQITNFWQITAGIAKMKTEQLSQTSVSSTDSSVTTTTGVRWSPDLTATLWTSYTLNAFTLGGGVRYVSDQKRVISKNSLSTTPDNVPEIPSYTVVDLMAAWKVSKNVNLQLNIGNLFDKEYISTLNNSGARMRLGAPRNASLTASVQF
ncbi:catecholate siderophore receptor Fiu [Ideonella azotifigens]|uniref:Catecholate siderophore receptor Fiu n=1 Tax=Ideonella azotifigens TaxID=513160 RepID=A0ABN1KDT4_9BURK|nr:catecholate siderophore receptor Fiu [Ideonella azotifigens]MCD2344505.1 catecholate siderophore receptor Fiu [Ideonella azotifigens]